MKITSIIFVALCGTFSGLNMWSAQMIYKKDGITQMVLYNVVMAGVLAYCAYLDYKRFKRYSK